MPAADATEVTVTVPAGAVTDPAGRASAASETLRVAVQGPESDNPPGPATNQELTASFHEAPATHGGAAALSFEVHISEAFKLRWLTMLNHAFTVTNARVIRARRLDNPHHEGHGWLPNQRWEITVKPGGTGDIAIALDAAADCSHAGAVCTPEGWKLSNSTSETVQRPHALSVADARVDEGMDGTIDFEATLSRTSTETMTVDYATADVTATAGQDYTATNGALTVDVRARTLLAHESGGYEEWGASGATRLSPGDSGLGPSLAVRAPVS